MSEHFYRRFYQRELFNRFKECLKEKDFPEKFQSYSPMPPAMYMEKFMTERNLPLKALHQIETVFIKLSDERYSEHHAIMAWYAINMSWREKVFKEMPEHGDLKDFKQTFRNEWLARSPGETMDVFFSFVNPEGTTQTNSTLRRVWDHIKKCAGIIRKEPVIDSNPGKEYPETLAKIVDTIIRRA